MVFKAFAAVNRLVVSWSERHFIYLTAVSANYFKHFFSLLYAVFSGNTAILATDWFVLEAFFCIKFLFAGRKNEFLSAILTD